MSHGFSNRSRDTSARESASPKASRLGLALFVLYLAAYSAFVGINAFDPALMEATPVGGVNLAIVYGMALIGGAFLLALLYAWFLRGKTE